MAITDRCQGRARSGALISIPLSSGTWWILGSPIDGGLYRDDSSQWKEHCRASRNSFWFLLSNSFSGRHEGTGDKRLSSLVTRSLNNSSLKTSWKSLMQSVTNLHLVQIIFYAASNFESQGLRDMNLFFPGYYRGMICKTKIFTVYTVVIWSTSRRM